MSYYVADNTIVEEGVTIGEETKIWYFSHIREGAKIGSKCNIGDYCYIDKKVIVGNDCKIGNNVSVYEGAILKDKIFIGNGTKFTNVRKPKAIKKAKKFLDTIIEDNVSIGANCTIVGGVKIGRNSIIGDGAVVIGDIPEDVFAVGNPAHITKKKITNNEEETK